MGHERNEPGGGATFGAHLRRLREAAGLSQGELANRAGVTTRAISALERGERKRPYPHTIRSLAAALGVSAAEQDALVARARRSGATPDDAPARSRLPAPLTPIVGRERELGNLAALVGDDRARLVTLTGPGGVGKTRLALELAHRVARTFPAGVDFVPLAALADPSLVLPAIARSVGATGSVGNGSVGTLAGALQGPRLLVLDNLEHLLAAARDVAALIAACPDLTVLATSREALRIRGEREYVVHPLAVPAAGTPVGVGDAPDCPAMALFVARMREAAANQHATAADAEAIAAICRRLDGLPLALELAAARTRLLSPTALAARLEISSLPLLTGGARDLPDRQRTMDAAIGWSYDLLDPGEARLFRRLSVFAAGFSLEAAESVAGDPQPGTPSPANGTTGSFVAILDGVASLADKSLVQRRIGPDGEPRFAMLAPIRDYAAAALADSGEADDIHRRHADWVLRVAEEAGPDLLGLRQEEAFDRLEVDLDNLRAAFHWLAANEHRADVLRLAGLLWPYWFSRGNHAEGRSWLDQAVAAADDATAPDRLRALLGAGMLATAQQDLGRATVLLRAARDVAIEACDRASEGRALFGLAVVAQDAGDPTAAEAGFTAALAAFDDAGDSLWSAITLGNLGLVTARRGDPDRGELLLKRSLVRHRADGFPAGEMLALRFLGQVARQRGDDATAADHFRASLEYWREAQGWHVAGALEGLAGIAAANDEAETAVRLYAAAAALRDAVGAPLEPALRPDQNAVLARLRTTLGNDALARCWDDGRSIGTAQAVAEARSVRPRRIPAATA